MKKSALVFILLCFFMFFSACKSLKTSVIESDDFVCFDFDFFYVHENEIIKETKNNDHRMEKIMQTWLNLNRLDERFLCVRSDIRDENFIPDSVAKDGEYIFDRTAYRFFFTSDFTAFINAPENALYKKALKMTLDAAETLIDQKISEEKS